ncbi:ATP-binding protein [Psychrobacter sp. NZS113]|uniref:ATP-binding protein n=1 Tax=Psychrobacter sp. NZS113 TaxID=2792045 RepID=UPI0018CEFD18|nr:ATP-binding protein [Psychrobacter sp. NZS113]MBH0097293.1 ATP-binding protein [Psychrobacter sp. NZS113]
MTKAKLKARSHILSLLGDELIGSDALAVFELVKNSYDADATNVDIIFEGIGTDNQRLTIRDNGHGMTSKVIDKVWLTLGTDFKRGSNRKVSNKGRISLGNKGVGRLAVHKIASNIDLKTKVLDSNIVHHLSFNWQNLIDSEEYIQNIEVELNSYEDNKEEFSDGQGTEIILTDFKDKKWNKTKIRDFYRKVSSIKSPFEITENNEDEFNVSIDLGDKNDWIADIHGPKAILKKAVYKFNFVLEKSSDKDIDVAKFSWRYVFNEQNVADSKFSNRTVIKNEDTLDVKDLLNEYYDDSEKDSKRKLTNADLDGIGKVQGEFYVYNLNGNIVSLFFQNEKTAIKQFIKDNYGVRIYRDGVRVFNYGEVGDDWLGLDYQKIQRAGDHFSRKVTIGAINLPLGDTNETLIEKTNREGFTENKYFDILKITILEVFRKFEREAGSDRDLIQEYVDGFKPVKKAGLSETIDELKDKLKDKGIEKEFEPLVGRIEQDYIVMRDVMVQSGMSGLNLSIVFHEVDRELRDIEKRLEYTDSKSEIDDVRIKVKSLVSVIDTFTPLLKSTKEKDFKVSDSIKRAYQIYERRFSSHNVLFSSPILTEEVSDFQIRGKSNLILSAINNIIDNSIYFLGYNDKNTQKAIHITTDVDNFNGNALIITDNGPGFSLDSEVVIQPFVTSKDNSMGIGLYLSNIVLESMGGQLLILDSSDYDIPKIYNGACIALVFPKK